MAVLKARKGLGARIRPFAANEAVACSLLCQFQPNHSKHEPRIPPLRINGYLGSTTAFISPFAVLFCATHTKPQTLLDRTNYFAIAGTKSITLWSLQSKTDDQTGGEGYPA
jgi:hypothetical protein